MKKQVWILLMVPLLTLPALSFGAAAINWDMDPIDTDLKNMPSLQNGMRLYMNYCIGCHSLEYQRYERTADDLGIPHEIALEKLIFTDQAIGGLMTTAMTRDAGKKWFGAAPPDLTMITRYKSSEYVYNYLKTFYVDETRPFGVNNKVFENVGMPNVLQELQGVQRDPCADISEEVKASYRGFNCDFLTVDPGTGLYSAEEFDQAAYDITNFLYYVGEPSRLERHRTGIYVLLFLVFIGCFTYLLNREYWKDVH